MHSTFQAIYNLKSGLGTISCNNHERAKDIPGMFQVYPLYVSGMFRIEKIKKR
jgi:hypothetical protein